MQEWYITTNYFSANKNKQTKGKDTVKATSLTITCKVKYLGINSRKEMQDTKHYLEKLKEI